MTLQSCDMLYLVTQSATLCGMWPWDSITHRKRTTLLFGSLYPKVVVTMRLVYLRLTWPVPLCLHKLCKVVYKGLRDGLTFFPFSALLRIPSILSELIVCIVWAFCQSVQVRRVVVSHSLERCAVTMSGTIFVAVIVVIVYVSWIVCLKSGPWAAAALHDHVTLKGTTFLTWGTSRYLIVD